MEKTARAFYAVFILGRLREFSIFTTRRFNRRIWEYWDVFNELTRYVAYGWG